MSHDAPTLSTPRLLLRPWRDSDLAPFAALNADPRVMEHFPGLLSRRESDAVAERIRGNLERRGFGLWALEVKDGGHFIGFVGLSVPGFEATFTPCVEVGWRLAFEHWGRGYATEAAREALRFGFETLRLAEVVSFTAVANARSRAVMERLGMTRDEREDFDHPMVPEGNRVRRHVLYRISRERWEAGRTRAR